MPHYGSTTDRMYEPLSIPPPLPAEDNVCAVEGCDNIVKTRGWCVKHYTRWRNHGDPLITHKVATRADEVCFAPECDKPAQGGGHGLCGTHYARWWRNGDLETHYAKGEDSPAWLGDNVGYKSGAHARVRKAQCRLA